MDVKTFINSTLSLFPKGRFFRKWIYDPIDGHLPLIEVFSEKVHSFFYFIDGLVNEIDPRKATPHFLLPFWEEFFDLKGHGLSLEKRREIVYSRLASSGGQSIEFYKSFLNGLGYEVEIKEYPPFKAGSKAGDKLEWPNRWSIKFKNLKGFRFKAGSKAGDKLIDYNIKHIERLLQKMKPGHTTLYITGDKKNVSN